jgi:hypothetical protein
MAVPCSGGPQSVHTGGNAGDLILHLDEFAAHKRQKTGRFLGYLGGRRDRETREKPHPGGYRAQHARFVSHKQLHSCNSLTKIA